MGGRLSTLSPLTNYLRSTSFLAFSEATSNAWDSVRRKLKNMSMGKHMRKKNKRFNQYVG